MHKDLYFIPLLAEAFAATDMRRALTAALGRIAQVGQLEQYRCGFAQYQTWLAAVAAATKRDTESPLVAELPWLHAQDIGLRVACDGTLLWAGRVERPTRIIIGDGVRPGSYSVETETGWMLTRFDLATSDLVWQRGDNARPIRVAADDGSHQPAPARDLVLPHVGLSIRVYRGREHGHIELLHAEADHGQE